AFGLRTLPKLIQSAKAQLEQKGLLSPPAAGPTRFGQRERRHVQRQHAEIVAIGAHLRRLVLDHTEADPHAVALLLRFAWAGAVRSMGRPVAAGLYHFFPPAEYPQLTALLRALRWGETTTLATQAPPELFKALRAIAVVAHQLRVESSSGGWGG